MTAPHDPEDGQSPRDENDEPNGHDEPTVHADAGAPTPPADPPTEPGWTWPHDQAGQAGQAPARPRSRWRSRTGGIVAASVLGGLVLLGGGFGTGFAVAHATTPTPAAAAHAKAGHGKGAAAQAAKRHRARTGATQPAPAAPASPAAPGAPTT